MSLDDLVKKSKLALKKKQFCIIKDFIKKKNFIEIKKILKKNFNLRKDIRVSGPFIYGQEDYKRLDIGDSYVNPKFLRFISFFQWNKKNKKLFNLIKPIFNFRNQLCNITQNKDFTYSIKNQKNKKYVYCDLVRMIQYPIGGGFLGQHCDKSKYFPKNILNILMPLSSRTKDKKKGSFNQGGLYYVKNNKKLDIEKYINTGDLILHNQNIYHGVSSIDPNKSLDIKNFNGRTTLDFSIGNFKKK